MENPDLDYSYRADALAHKILDLCRSAETAEVSLNAIITAAARLTALNSKPNSHSAESLTMALTMVYITSSLELRAAFAEAAGKADRVPKLYMEEASVNQERVDKLTLELFEDARGNVTDDAAGLRELLMAMFNLTGTLMAALARVEGLQTYAPLSLEMILQHLRVMHRIGQDTGISTPPPPEGSVIVSKRM